ncbi:hypothetical protein Tco_1082046 [Tanacetum coccineum]|uniref:Uncharacterized protein n=1 Tax=Tanacetum coccineum TaxID=301880 RepID=A0ABQ5HZB8_9ASTR
MVKLYFVGNKLIRNEYAKIELGVHHGGLEASYYKKLGGELLNGELLNGELLNGELLNGELLNGELLNGELLNGELLNSELLNGELPNSDLSILLGQRVVKRSSGMKEMDRYRCTLRPETVEALYCAKDWLRSEIFVNMDSVVKMEFPI